MQTASKVGNARPVMHRRMLTPGPDEKLLTAELRKERGARLQGFLNGIPAPGSAAPAGFVPPQQAKPVVPIADAKVRTMSPGIEDLMGRQAAECSRRLTSLLSRTVRTVFVKVSSCLSI